DYYCCSFRTGNTYIF
nr:immunoglobulin light chain junction region [Macaca mulatta]MOX69788.1 immunoglobulin light chain junction region [Macaca mulatta]MOX70614.1 immunoglobulin light chain junction region [Macaca mulatta]MOX70702.1 immunoglobulin light chain junction region [Macaca mulatta]MOX70810.1 immunoglobulin light chain junction region [Macaca mulatta]